MMEAEARAREAIRQRADARRATQMAAQYLGEAQADFAGLLRNGRNFIAEEIIAFFLRDPDDDGMPF